MKIIVERTCDPESSSSLTFTIKVTEPHDAPFDLDNKKLLGMLDICDEVLDEIPADVAQPIRDAIHETKSQIFSKLEDSLKFAIENSLKTKFEPICQEIYNWIYDHQRPPIKKWMLEFNPQRTRYYFDNDRRADSDDE